MSVSDATLYFVGDLKRWRATATKDGVAWTLTAATLYLVKPDGTILTRAGVQESGSVWHYDSVASDLDTRGSWRRYWVCTDGVTTETFGDFSFFVNGIGYS